MRDVHRSTDSPRDALWILRRWVLLPLMVLALLALTIVAAIIVASALGVFGYRA